MSDRFAFRVCSVAGLLSFVCVGLLLLAYPIRLPSEETSYLPPALAIQFIIDEAILLTIFGAEDSPARSQTVAAMKRGNIVDYGFMSIYSLFLCLFFYGQRLKTSVRAWLTVIPMVGVVLAFDILENLTLTDVVAGLDGPEIIRHLVQLQLFSWGKWSTLAVISALGGLAFLSRGSVVPGLFCLLPLLVVLPAYQTPAKAAVFLVLGVGLSWIFMLAHALRRGFFMPPAACLSAS